jgi:hypothetical protein
MKELKSKHKSIFKIGMMQGMKKGWFKRDKGTLLRNLEEI